MKKDGHYYTVATGTGKKRGNGIDSLQSFWPGLQVLVGDTSDEITSHSKLWNIWNR